MNESMGKLFVIVTPIGNLSDLSYRAARVLGEVDALACEDTRVTRLIYERYRIQRPRAIFSYHEHNEDSAGKRILGLLERGLSVGLCTNAGSPGISDPGYRIVSLSVERGFPVEVIPGASAVTTALLASGLPTSSYTFKGFAPRKKGARRRFLEVEQEGSHTLVFFESPRRLAGFLSELVDVYGNRRAAVCIELTKKFEKVHRGYLSDLKEKFEDRKLKGEVTVVVAGKHAKFLSR